MSIAQMKKVQIFAMRDDLTKVSKILQNLSIIEIAKFSGDDAQASNSAFSETLQNQLGDLDRRLAEVGRALNFLEQLAPLKPSIVEQFAGIKTYLTPEEYEGLLGQTQRLTGLLTELQQLEGELTRLQTERGKVQTQIDLFKPWIALTLDGKALKGTSNIKVLLASAEASAAQVSLFLDELEFPYYMETVFAGNTNTLFALMFDRSDYPKLQGIFAKRNITIIGLPVFETTVAEKVLTLQGKLDDLNVETARIKERVLGLNQERSLLQAFYDAYLSEKARVESTRQFAYASNSVGIAGWVVAERLPQLEEELKRQKITHVIREIEIEPGEEQPVVLENAPIVSPFEYLVQSFSYPLAREVDPSVMIAPFFFIFFGIALGDAGYGLMLALICAGLLLKLKMGPVGRKISWMFLVSGLGAVAVGLFTGSVLSLPTNFGVFNPLENPILLLVISLALGLIQLYLGIIVSAWGSIKAGRWVDAIWNQGFWLLFLTAVVLVLGKDTMGLSAYSTAFNYTLLVAAVGLIINNVRSKEGWVAKLLAIPGSFFTFYNSIGFFSDVLSYSRLMALGLSGGVMGGIMNQLAWMVVESIPVAGWVIGALIFVGGHLLNMALSILGAYVHSSRLQYLEFFSKFFEGGGKAFTPLQNKQKYTFLINKREA